MVLSGKNISILKFSKVQNSIKNEGGVAILNLCTLFDDALYLYKFREGFRVIVETQFP